MDLSGLRKRVGLHPLSFDLLVTVGFATPMGAIITVAFVWLPLVSPGGFEVVSVVGSLAFMRRSSCTVRRTDLRGSLE